jgi:3-deoxy-D-manno-octulosonic-acid transferase
MWWVPLAVITIANLWPVITREANRVAHVLAQMAMSTRSRAEWKLCAPARILDLLN